MLSLAFLPLCHSSPSPADAIETWLRTAHGRVPFGLAPGISGVTVSDGKIQAFGLGVQRHGSPAPADGDTLYEIGSLSKTMVALGLATLVTSGTLAGTSNPAKLMTVSSPPHAPSAAATASDHDSGARTSIWRRRRRRAPPRPF